MLRRPMAPEAPTLRPARALLGWLSDKQARRLLTSHRPEVDLTDEQRGAVEAARAAVAARPKFQVLSPIVAPCPEVLHAHRAALYGHERFKTFRDENWEIAIVDLGRVCVVQHTVGTDSDARYARLDGSDLQALANITLPIPNPQSLSYQVDSQRNVAALSSPDGNLPRRGFRRPAGATRHPDGLHCRDRNVVPPGCRCRRPIRAAGRQPGATGTPITS
jgi:hypothetical protein